MRFTPIALKEVLYDSTNDECNGIIYDMLAKDSIGGDTHRVIRLTKSYLFD